MKPIVLTNKIKKFILSINDEDYKLTLNPKKSEQEIKIHFMHINQLFHLMKLKKIYQT